MDAPELGRYETRALTTFAGEAWQAAFSPPAIHGLVYDFEMPPDAVENVARVELECMGAPLYQLAPTGPRFNFEIKVPALYGILLFVLRLRAPGRVAWLRMRSERIDPSDDSFLTLVGRDIGLSHEIVVQQTQGPDPRAYYATELLRDGRPTPCEVDLVGLMPRWRESTPGP